MTTDKNTRGNAAQFFVAGELCRQGYAAVVTLGNCPNTDILCSNVAGTRFVHVQIKTFVPGNRSCSLGGKAERDYGPNFFWVLAGIPLPGQEAAFEYYIVPAADMARHTSAAHGLWLAAPGRSGQAHRDNPMRNVILPPRKPVHPWEWDLRPYRNRWQLIDEILAD